MNMSRCGYMVATSLHLDGLFRRRHTLFDKRVPLVAVRALPEQLGRSIVTLHAHVRIEEEDGFASECDIPLHERAIETDLKQHCPDGLVHRERVRVVLQRFEHQFETGGGLISCGEMTPERNSRTPRLRVGGND